MAKNGPGVVVFIIVGLLVFLLVEGYQSRRTGEKFITLLKRDLNYLVILALSAFFVVFFVDL